MRGTVRRNFVTGPPKRATRRLRCAPRNTDALRPCDQGRASVDRTWAGDDRDKAAADRADLRDIGRDATEDSTAQD